MSTTCEIPATVIYADTARPTARTILSNILSVASYTSDRVDYTYVCMYVSYVSMYVCVWEWKKCPFERFENVL